MQCPCRGDHHAGQHDSQAALYARLATPARRPNPRLANPIYERPGGDTMTLEPARTANAHTGVQCGHNANGDFLEPDGSDGEQCIAQATSLTVFNDWDGVQRLEFRCDDQDHLSLLWDTVEANPDAFARVLQLVDVTVGALGGGRADVRVDRSDDHHTRLTTWKPQD